MRVQNLSMTLMVHALGDAVPREQEANREHARTDRPDVQEGQDHMGRSGHTLLILKCVHKNQERGGWSST